MDSASRPWRRGSPAPAEEGSWASDGGTDAAENVPPESTMAWVQEILGEGARIVRVRPIQSGSTAMSAIDAVDPQGRPLRLALRRFVDAGRLGTDPWYVPANEAAVLHLLE